MQNVILYLHVACAIVLWALSAKGFINAGSKASASKLRRVRSQIIGFIMLTSILGLLTAHISSSITLVVCARIGLYITPSLLSIFALQQRLRFLSSGAKES